MVEVVRKGHRAIKVSWTKLIRMTKAERDVLFIRAQQVALAKANEPLIKAAKAQRKADHIARMVAVAASKKRR